MMMMMMMMMMVMMMMMMMMRMMMRMMMVVFVVRLTDKWCLASFPALTIVRNPNHHKSPTCREQA